MRCLAWLCVACVLGTTDLRAEDAPTAPIRATCELAPPAIPARAIELPAAARALARGSAADEVLVGLEDGQVLRVDATGAVAWRGRTGGGAADELAASPRGDVVAAAVAGELLVLGGDDGTALWRMERPVAFAFADAPPRLVTIDKAGAIVAWNAATGEELDRQRVAEKRAVVKASLHAGAGLAVLGIADG